MKVSEEKCFGDGKVYKINEILERVGDEYSSKFKNTVLSLYSSDSYKDNLMAIFTVASLSEHFTMLEREFDPYLKFKVYCLIL